MYLCRLYTFKLIERCRKPTLVVTATIVAHTHKCKHRHEARWIAMSYLEKQVVGFIVLMLKQLRVNICEILSRLCVRFYLTDIHNNKIIKYLLFIARRVYDILRQCPRHCYIKKRLRKNRKFLTYETVRILHNISYICLSICQLINLR